MPIGIDLMRVISIEKVSKGTDALEIYFFFAQSFARLRFT